MDPGEVREGYSTSQPSSGPVGVGMGLRHLLELFLRAAQGGETTGAGTSPSSLPILPWHRAQRSGTLAMLGEAVSLCLFLGTQGPSAVSSPARQSKEPRGPGGSREWELRNTARPRAAVARQRPVRGPGSRPAGGREHRGQVGVPGPAPPAWGRQQMPRPPSAPGRSGAERSRAEQEQHAGARPRSWRLQAARHHPTPRATPAPSADSGPKRGLARRSRQAVGMDGARSPCEF